MKRLIIYLLFVLIGSLLASCGQNDNKSNNRLKDEASTNESIKQTPKIYGIEGEDIFIRVGPGENYEKLVNEKATEMQNETVYAEVDYSCTVIITESMGDWSKIRVVDPDWLSRSHVGWIPTKYILKGESEENKPLEKLAKSDYEIIKTDHNSSVQNFYVLIKYSKFDKESVYEFIKKFRNDNCSRDCNIYVYDSKSILSLVDKYPIEGSDYISLADHFVAMSTFDAPKYKSWYPFQDIKYKELGGNNWKKEPIK